MKKRSRPQSCNVVSLGVEARRLWHFSTRGSRISLIRESSGTPDSPLPFKEVGKDWRDLFQSKLNIAWLPAEHVFLRVVHMPATDAAELRSMVEFQLEKLSPLPLAQIVWSYEVLPRTGDTLQTLIVIIVARPVVEEFLGRLEKQGYLADLLEVPAIHQLLATPADGDGVWIYPRATAGRVSCLVAWWYGGVLREVGLVHLPSDGAAAATLRAYISNTAFAGELDGWLTAPPRWHVVADHETAAATAALWETDEDLHRVEPPAENAVAEFSAQKTAAGQPQANLLPAEFGARYRQQYVDRLWMRSLGAVFVAYCVGVLIYFGWLQVVNYKANGVATQLRQLSGPYTNALRLKARAEVMQDQFNLRYAALDAWRVVSENLPDGLKLNSFGFSKGKSVNLFGECPSDAFEKLAEFNRALARATLNNGSKPFFARVDAPVSNVRGGTHITWSFACEMSSAEIP